MDCNREEAIRAKDIAEKKMQSKDFLGARKIALKAQQLYPDVENISQMLIVCDVHCSAAKKLAGGDLDWYGILQVEKAADEATIKKQYRKFALQLHPDKNNFSGAEGAFKLITEAQGILLDKEKRRQHDMKLGSGIHRPPHSNWNANVNVHPYANRSHLYANRSHPSVPYFQNLHPQQPAHPGHPDPNLTFWTTCPFCNVKFQYYKEIMNRSIRCQTCYKPFVAYDMQTSAAANFSKPVFPQMNNTYKVEVRVPQNAGTGNPRAAPVQNAGQHITPDVGTAKANRGREKKRVRKQNQISDSEPSDSSSNSESEEEMEVDENGDLKDGQNFSHPGDQSVRRSSRQKQQVSYKENISDDDDVNDDDRASKKAKGKSSSAPTEENGSVAEDKSAETKEDTNGVNLKEGDEEECCIVNGDKARKREAPKSPVEGQPKKSFEDQHNANSSSEGLFSYPDPDFNDFEKGRAKELFAAGQIWAAYDDKDAMPRFYAKIGRILLPEFQVVITWLEPDPDDANEIKWHSGDLPISCGYFKYGTTDMTDNLPMFSHQIEFVNGSRKNAFVIHPRKGETWAIFKNWDIKWNCDPAAKQKNGYEYEFVEILSNYVDGVGIHVALLSKVNGFVSLFGRTVNVGKRTFLIPPGELLRFSHMVPSYKMKGDEGEGVPEGSFELDPASLPANLVCSLTPERKAKPMMGCDYDMKKSDSQIQSQSQLQTQPQPQPRPQPQTESQPQPKDSSVPSASAPEVPYPETQFHDFEAARSEDKFQTGQVWAVYSDEDTYPKYYCRIEKVDKPPAFKLYVSWLMCSGLGNAIKWSDPELPVSCGWFRIRRKFIQAYETNSSFSHLVSAVPTTKRNEYIIVPCKGQIWALYKNWSGDMKISDLNDCKYDVVEVISVDESQIKVVELERVTKCNSVFKLRVQEGSTLPVERGISRVELFRFSHQIPAFRLTEERRGKFRGSWELDPAAVPTQYFRS